MADIPESQTDETKHRKNLRSAPDMRSKGNKQTENQRASICSTEFHGDSNGEGTIPWLRSSASQDNGFSYGYMIIRLVRILTMYIYGSSYTLMLSGSPCVPHVPFTDWFLYFPFCMVMCIYDAGNCKARSHGIHFP